jgi:hypothetical protein
LLFRSDATSTKEEAMPTQRAASTSWAYVEKAWRGPRHEAVGVFAVFRGRRVELLGEGGRQVQRLAEVEHHGAAPARTAARGLTLAAAGPAARRAASATSPQGALPDDTSR